MVFQTDKGLDVFVNLYGCYLLCLLYIRFGAEDFSKLDVSDVNSLYFHFYDSRVIDQDCYVLKPLQITNQNYTYVHKYKMKYIRHSKRTNCSKLSDLPGYLVFSLRADVRKRHFVIAKYVDGQRTLVYDPTPNSKAWDKGDIVSYRYYF